MRQALRFRNLLTGQPAVPARAGANLLHSSAESHLSFTLAFLKSVSLSVLQMRGAQRRTASAGLAPGGIRAARMLAIAIQLELANDAVQVAREFGEILERFHGFYSTLRIFQCQLRDLAGGFGDFARGSRLLR